ncbi:penicillin-binding protein 1A [Leptospira interrogans]|uniref:penicillin-binding protein 1A n=1 Tax=Leptospira interrogans TaxID=173 RepID=UPI0002BEF530|nr:PBP1A family penicillin-binding protein [Leptospira interrogans]EMO00380.1 penicillin-binding protein, 1A family [Leptospira interrogans serovar Pomona str. UT364]
MKSIGLHRTSKTLLVIALLGGLFFGYILSEVDEGGELAMLASYQPTTPTRLYDINGVVFAELYKHKQQLLKYQDIPPHVVQAFLSVEDNNFFNHFGIDFMAILRAGIVNVISGRIKQGGSTLTQQLAKTVLQNRKRSFARKFIEALFTLQIEQEYSKEEILEIYFNLIYLGHGTTGLASAADVYFQKDVSDLDVAEAALLARLPKAPVKYSPFKNPAISKGAHLSVLRLMAEQGYIPTDRIQTIHDDFWNKYWPVVITQSPSQSTWGNRLNKAPHFTEYVRQKLEKELGEDKVYTGGLKVYTTLDARKQEIAQDELSKAIKKHDDLVSGITVNYSGGADRGLVGLYYLMGSVFPIGMPFISKLDDKANYRVALERELIDAVDILTILTPGENESAAISEFQKQTAIFGKNLHVEGAAITIEPSTGYIQTMVGGYEFTPKNQFNRATMARRQTGSAFKPFVYGAAIQERVVGSGTGIMDAPLTTLTEEGEGWSPQDFDGDFLGMVPLSRALSLSLNIVSVQVFLRTGPDAVIDFSSRLLGVNPNRFPPSPALALGIAELTPLEMALGYATIANNGRRVIPFSVRYVIDQSGNIIYNEEVKIQGELQRQAKDGSIQVISEGTAYILKKMLTNVAMAGTAAMGLRDPEKGNYRGIAAGKTGSTSSFTNAWYCGFDPNYTTVIWLGFDKSSISLGRGQAASVLAVPIWGRMYNRFYGGQNYPSFGEDVIPEEVQGGGTCAYNGLSPKPGVCPVTQNLTLKPITVAGVTKAVMGNRQCDGERDHHKSMDFREFLQKEYQISDEELGKTDRKFKPRTE